MNIIVDLMATAKMGEQRHAQVIMRELGITYRECRPRPIVDDWIFYDCENVPEKLPSYLERVEGE